MKLKNIFIGSLCLGLLACSDEKTSPDNVNVQEQEVRVFGSVLSNSRVSFEQDGNVTHAYWNDGDKIGIYAGTQQNLGYSVLKDGMTVEFKPEGEILKCVDGTTVVAYYPYAETVEDMIVPLPNMANYVWSEMKPFVYASNVVGNSRVSLNFKHPYAYLKVTFGKKNLPEWAEEPMLNAVEIAVEGKKLGVEEGYFNLRNCQQTMTVTTPVVKVDAANFDLNVSDFCCYIPVLPQEAGQPISFKFIQKNGSVSDVLFACEKKASVEGLLAGYVYEVALNDEELPMSPEKLKSKLNAIGKEFVGNFKAGEFNEVKNTARYIKDTFCKKSTSTNSVTTWYEACLEAITEKVATRDTTERDQYESYNYIRISEYYYHYKDLTRVYAASQFVGHFAVKNNVWVKEEGDFNDMQFTAPDEDGTLCTLKLTTAGEAKKVYIGNNETEDWYNWTSEQEDSVLYEYRPTGYIDPVTGVELIDTIPVRTITIYKYAEDVDVNTYRNYVFIPETVTLEYTKGEELILKTVINTNHAALKSDRWDMAAEALSIAASTYVNGYEFVMNKMAYEAGKNMEVSFKLNKNGANLLTLSAYSDMTLVGDIYEDEDAEFERCQNVTLNMDIIHQAQLKFACTDVMELDEHMNLAEDNDTDETIFKEQLAEMNKLISGGLYLDGQATRQAWVTLEPFLKESYYGNYWTWDPVMNFSDGSNYSTFSVFFNEDDFMSLINIAWDVVDDFANLAHQFDHEIEF